MSAVFDGRTFFDGALTYTVELSTDPDASPSDVDHYGDADLIAYRRGAWQYVTVNVTAKLTFSDGHCHDEIELGDTLSAVEFGDLGEQAITLERLIAEYPVPEMIAWPETALPRPARSSASARRTGRPTRGRLRRYACHPLHRCGPGRHRRR
jgi:hypothetical protein